MSKLAIGILSVGALLVAGATGMLLQRQLDAPEATFATRVGAPLRIAVPHLGDAEGAFRAALAAEAPAGLIEAEPPDVDAEADVIVHFVTDVKALAPVTGGRADLRGTYDVIRSRSEPSVQYYAEATQGRPIMVVAFDIDHYPGWDAGCYAWMLVQTVDTPEGATFEPPARCPF